MRLDEEADTAGAVYYLGWIKEKEEKKREKIVPIFCCHPSHFLLSSLSCCKFVSINVQGGVYVHV